MQLEDNNNKDFDIFSYLIIAIGNNFSYVLIFTIISILSFFLLSNLNKTFIYEATIPININLDNESIEKFDLLDGSVAKFNDPNYKKRYISNKFTNFGFFSKNFYHLYPTSNEKDVYNIFKSLKFYNSKDTIVQKILNGETQSNQDFNNLMININYTVIDPNLVKYDLKKVLKYNLDQISNEINYDISLSLKNQISKFESELDLIEFNFYEKNRINIVNLENESKYYNDKFHSEFYIYLELIEHNLQIAYELGYVEPLIHADENLKQGIVPNLNLKDSKFNKDIYPLYLYGTQILTRELEYLKNLNLEQHEPLLGYALELEKLNKLNFLDTEEALELLSNKENLAKKSLLFNKLTEDKDSIFISYYSEEIEEKITNNSKNFNNFLIFLISGFFLGIIIAIFKHALNIRNISWISEFKLKL